MNTTGNGFDSEQPRRSFWQRMGFGRPEADLEETGPDGSGGLGPRHDENTQTASRKGGNGAKPFIDQVVGEAAETPVLLPAKQVGEQSQGQSTPKGPRILSRVERENKGTARGNPENTDAEFSTQLLGLVKFIDLDEKGVITTGELLKQIFSPKYGRLNMLAQGLAECLREEEKHQKTDVAISCGPADAILANNVTAALNGADKIGQSVTFLPMEKSSDGVQSEKFVFSYGSESAALRNKRVLLIVSVVTPESWKHIQACIDFIERGQEAGVGAKVFAIASVIQIGEVPSEVQRDIATVSLFPMQPWLRYKKTA